MKIKIPEKIRVGGIDYSVIMEETFVDDGMNHWGFHHGGDATIRLLTIYDSEPMADCTILSGLFHELCHAIDFVYCLSDLEESTIEKISNSVFTILSNDFFIGQKKMPESLTLKGMTFEVINNYEFKSLMKCPTVSLRPNTLKIHCIEGGETVKKDLLNCIIGFMLDGLFTQEEFEKFPLNSFSSGLYQVLKDTGFNKLVMRVCK